MPLGRWSLWRAGPENGDDVSLERTNEFLARQLLKRYGVVVRELLARETRLPPWRTLLESFRRLEARGEIRGGRFISGSVGEQYALPEAVEMLRSVRRSGAEPAPVIISCADPLNLVGILTPGTRVSPYSNQVVAYVGGVPVEVAPLGEVLSRLQQPRIAPRD